MATFTTQGAMWGECALLSGVSNRTDAPTMMTSLESLRDALQTVPGVATCKIGLEQNICPDDYPIIRVVPSRIDPGGPYSKRLAEVMIYFGAPVQPFDTTPDDGARIELEKVYAALFAMDDDIRAVIHAQKGIYRGTITDEDRLDTYKLMAIRCEISG